MPNLSTSAGTGESEGLSRIVVTSIGTARPAAAATVSKGLGLSPEQVVACLYRAPSVLIGGVEAGLATQLAGLLTGIGLEIRVDAESLPLPEAEPTLDVALYIRDAGAAIAVSRRLAAFLGCTEERALELIVTPPGLILGGVSPATVAALGDQLPEDVVDIVASRGDTGRYDLFVADPPPVVLDALRRDLTARGVEVLDAGGLIASGLDYDTGNALWRRYQASGSMRLIDQAFERFDLVLMGSNRPPPSARQEAALVRLAGVPEDLTDSVFDNLPLTLEEGLRHAQVAKRLEAYQAEGLRVSARLTTFQYVAVEVLDCEDRQATAQALSSFGLLAPDAPLPALPYRAEVALPELQARMLRAGLEPLGTEIGFTEPEA